MLVRYRLDSIPTIAQFKADIDGIIQGTITQVNQLSAPAQSNSSFYGSYPTGTFTRVNSTSYTYSKTHNTESKTHYFRLTFDSTQLTTITLAQGYTSGTDTLLNSTAKTVNIQCFKYDVNYPASIDIIVNDKMIYFQASQSGVQAGILDMGHNGVTRAYSDSMLMAYHDLNDIINTDNSSYTTQLQLFLVNNNASHGASVPYTYNLDTLSYGSASPGYITTTPLKKATTTKSVFIIENTVYMYTYSNGNALNSIYGLYKLPTGAFAGIQLYKDSSNLYRLAVNDFSLLVD